MTLHSFNLLSRNSYYHDSPGGPGIIGAIAIGVAIALALAVSGSWAIYRERRRREAAAASQERQKRWYEAELRRDNIAAAAAADEQAREQALGMDELHRDGQTGRGREEDPPPSYEGPAAPLRSLSMDLGRQAEG